MIVRGVSVKWLERAGKASWLGLDPTSFQNVFLLTLNRGSEELKIGTWYDEIVFLHGQKYTEKNPSYTVLSMGKNKRKCVV